MKIRQKIRQRIGDGVNELIAGTLEGIGERIIELKGPHAPATAGYQLPILREAAHIVRANRHLSSGGCGGRVAPARRCS